MTAHLLWFKGSQRENYVNEIYPTACLCNDLTLFLISSLIADTIYDFFLGWWVLCFLFLFSFSNKVDFTCRQRLIVFK